MNFLQSEFVESDTSCIECSLLRAATADTVSSCLVGNNDRYTAWLELEVPFRHIDPDVEIGLIQVIDDWGWLYDYESGWAGRSPLFEIITPEITPEVQSRFLTNVPNLPAVFETLLNDLESTSLQMSFDFPKAIDDFMMRDKPLSKLILRNLQIVMCLCTAAFCTKTRIEHKKTIPSFSIEPSTHGKKEKRLQFGGTYLKWQQNVTESQVVGRLVDCFCHFMRPILQSGSKSSIQQWSYDPKKAGLWETMVSEAQILFDIRDNNPLHTLTARDLRQYNWTYEKIQRQAQEAICRNLLDITNDQALILPS